MLFDFVPVRLAVTIKCTNVQDPIPFDWQITDQFDARSVQDSLQ